mmetsp:Transcript_27832/g.24627  ORF Transcript_27832/g.24627 Transcript_27832/m.24627 type:complete len:129 (+) Transcript_27832:1546-1932(+)
MVGKMQVLGGLFGGQIWAPWAKVTFTAYLSHICILVIVVFQTKGSIYMTGTLGLFYSFIVFFLTIILSIPITLIIESPILQLEKLILFPQKIKIIALKKEEKKLLMENHETLISDLSAEEKLEGKLIA